ncbi:interleukin-12 subunit beta [Cololabis saira]|uniref:interleukin-12 subunit beta n=1 Tax=Cololabis saira TaxID=129043 RepID=UPI002AD5B005|nr:interleukin-12 subunit beta [Cololabis saira]
MWLSGLLLVSVTAAHELTLFPEKFEVVKEGNAEPVKLTCNAKADESVTWMFEGDEVEFNDAQRNGTNLVVSNVDAPMLGEYSCTSKGQTLSTTHILMEPEDQQGLDAFLSCRAKSYDCEFTCNWNDTSYTAVRLGLTSNCTDGLSSCQWHRSSGELHSGGFQFVLPHFLSPFAEESTMLELTVEAVNNDFYFLRRTKRFYLRDIVQPDSPRIIRCQEVNQHLNVTIEPPSSWSTPHSFFSLEHEIEYILKDNGKIGRSSTAQIPKRISRLRVRSRDSLVPSTWSQWTPWKDVRKRVKNLCKCRKRVCCSELPPGSLDHCKNRKQKKTILMKWDNLENEMFL